MSRSCLKHEWRQLCLGKQLDGSHLRTSYRGYYDALPTHSHGFESRRPLQHKVKDLDMTQEEYNSLTDENKELYKNFYCYQRMSLYHPLTCGEDSNHEVLDLRFREDGTSYLICEDCGYTQQHYPGFVLNKIPDQSEDDTFFSVLRKTRLATILEEFNNKYNSQEHNCYASWGVRVIPLVS